MIRVVGKLITADLSEVWFCYVISPKSSFCGLHMVKFRVITHEGVMYMFSWPSLSCRHIENSDQL